MTPADLAYRTTAAQDSSGFGLLIALYDTLAGDLRRAAAAQRASNLEKRARELKHALMVVAHLENWTEGQGGELAQKLLRFYAQTRRIILQAQAKQSAQMLEDQMNETLRIREIWQQIDQRREADGPEILPPAPTPRYGGYLQMQAQHQLSWSA
jgi:flagellar biosynthetic protein FliS